MGGVDSSSPVIITIVQVLVFVVIVVVVVELFGCWEKKVRKWNTRVEAVALVEETTMPPTLKGEKNATIVTLLTRFRSSNRNHPFTLFFSCSKRPFLFFSDVFKKKKLFLCIYSYIFNEECSRSVHTQMKSRGFSWAENWVWLLGRSNFGFKTGEPKWR